MEHYDFFRLAVDFQHVSAYRDLPLHHQDPFDRMLAAQARADGLVLVTSDRMSQAYGIPVVWAG